MNIDDITFALIDALEASGCDYILVGAIAAMQFGVSRSTLDVDAVVGLKSGDVSQIVNQLGPSFQLELQREFEVFTAKHFHVIHAVNSPFKIDLFPLTNDPFDQERFRRRQRLRLDGRHAWLPTAEDVVIQKLRWGRNKDLDDARDILAVQADALDWKYLESWCDKHGTRETLAQLRLQIPPT
jgi:hypothetical protein